MRKLKRSRKGVSLVLATLLMVMITFAAGIMLYEFVMGQVNNVTNNLNTQMSLLLLDSARINSTTITAFLRNTGQYTVEILNAYVNSEIASLAQTVKIATSTTGISYIQFDYYKGNTYSVKLAGMFGALITFDVKYD